MTEPTTTTVDGLCGICGDRQPVQAAIVAWRDPVFALVMAVDRCVDRAACRVRVEAACDRWPVLEPKEDPR